MRAPGSLILPGEAISPGATILAPHDSKWTVCICLCQYTVSGGAGHSSRPISDRSLVVCSRFAKHDQFSVGDEDSDYTLSVSGYQSASTAVHRTPFRIHQR